MNKEIEDRSSAFDPYIKDCTNTSTLFNTRKWVQLDDAEKVLTQEVERATKGAEKSMYDAQGKLLDVQRERDMLAQDKIELKAYIESENNDKDIQIKSLKEAKQEQIRIANQHQTAYKKLKEENERLKNKGVQQGLEFIAQNLQLTKYKEVVVKALIDPQTGLCFHEVERAIGKKHCAEIEKHFDLTQLKTK